MMSWWSDVVLAIESAMGGEANVENTAGPATATVPSGPLMGVTDAILAVWTGLTDGKFWRSLGWILLGIVLMLLGVGWWIGPSAARSSPTGTIARGLT